jgi:hypothetical protein
VSQIITYEQRVSKMKCVGDEDKQLKLAKQYVSRLRNKLKKVDTLNEKIEINNDIKMAESVLRQLRLNVFDLEDMLIEKSLNNIGGEEISHAL